LELSRFGEMSTAPKTATASMYSVRVMMFDMTLNG
jgi:hypothetical protein